MPSNPPTVVDLASEVATECGLMLVDVGLYLRSPDGTTPAIVIGLRKGAKAVMATLLNPLVLQDSDVASMSSFAIERVLDEAKLHALQWVLLNWHRATQSHQSPLSTSAIVSGSLIDEKRGIKDRVSELKAICSVPFREPSDPAVLVDRFGDTYPSAPQGQQPVVVSPGGDIIAPTQALVGPWPCGYRDAYGPWGWEGGWL